MLFVLFGTSLPNSGRHTYSSLDLVILTLEVFSCNKKWGFWVLTAFVVGNMVGAGIFMVPSTLAQTASPLGVTLAWLTTGFGV